MGSAETESDPIRRRMESLSVEHLLLVVGEEADDWQPEAQAIAREELRRRGVSKIPTPDPVLQAKIEAAERAAVEEDARGDMVVGGLVCIGGTVFAAASYLQTPANGGISIIAWGAIVVGFLKFVRGFFAWIDRR